jgi:ABC-type multidrug transport system fused ATPase/permease subunit
MITEQMSAGTFTAFILGFNLLMQPILALLQLNIIRANAESGLDRIMRVMQVAESTPEPPPEKKVDADKQARDTRHNTEAGIVFDDVHFSYDGETPVYRGVSCQVEDGESVALVGPSGSGKTTFVSLLMRFYDSQQGRIIVNGVDIREYGIRELRSMFGVVPQDPFVFQATLRDNICVTAPEASEDAIQHAMDIACMTEFVDELPHGIHTWLGEGGSNLSGGQRQRLAIARAILANPRYYIFDEATSALDNTSERRIQSSMEQIMKDHTTIIIAHRLSTIRNVDRILVFDHGRVIQSGSYAELAAQPGLFAELLQAAEDTGHFD